MRNLEATCFLIIMGIPMKPVHSKRQMWEHRPKWTHVLWGAGLSFANKKINFKKIKNKKTTNKLTVLLVFCPHFSLLLLEHRLNWVFFVALHQVLAAYLQLQGRIQVSRVLALCHLHSRPKKAFSQLMKDIVDLAVYYKSWALISGPSQQVHPCSSIQGCTEDNAPFRSNPALC